MKFALRVPGNFLYPAVSSPWEAAVTADDTIRFARKAEDLGFDWLWVSEHMLMVPEFLPIQGGRFYEALSAAAVLLGATNRMRLLTYVAVLPYHNPIVYAKQIATVDVLSGGRLTMGLASGHLQKEFAALKIPFAERGRRMDEYLRVMKELWTAERPTYRGEFYQFDNVVFEPKPVSKPHTPIYMGGDARPVIRRAAILAEGWIPWLTLPSEVPEWRKLIDEERAKHGRSGPFEIVMVLADFPPEDRLNLNRTKIPRTRDEVTRLLERLKEAGADGVALHLPQGTSGLDECMDWVEWFARDIMPVWR